VQKKLDSKNGLIGESEALFSLALAIERRLHVTMSVKKETSLK